MQLGGWIEILCTHTDFWYIQSLKTIAFLPEVNFSSGVADGKKL
jgi:hypothetical protein